MVKIGFKGIILRDMIKSDIADYVRWFTEETEWLDWDEPWDPVQTDKKTEQDRWTKCWMSSIALPEKAPRKRFEIEAQSRHIGCVLSYPIDENFSWVPDAEHHPEQIVSTAIGIDICDPAMQGHGYGTQAMEAFLRYLHSLGHKELYLETWSGNLRVIGIMDKLGFTLCRRFSDRWVIQGKQYDDLIYRHMEAPEQAHSNHTYSEEKNGSAGR